MVRTKLERQRQIAEETQNIDESKRQLTSAKLTTSNHTNIKRHSNEQESGAPTPPCCR